MNKTLLKSVREYKKQSVMAPLLVVLEVFMEVLIPLEMAKIIDVGIAQGDMNYIIQRGVILVVMAMLALFFGVQAGNMAAVAGAGYAKNLRHDIFYKIQEFSFHNIDHFSTSGLVTRMTTDITNVQMAYMMSIRLLARAPIMVILSWVMTPFILPASCLPDSISCFPFTLHPLKKQSRHRSFPWLADCSSSFRYLYYLQIFSV